MMDLIRTKPTWKPFKGTMYIMLPSDRRGVIPYRGFKRYFVVTGAWCTGWIMKYNPGNKLKWKLDSKVYYQRTHRYNRSHKK